MIATKTITLHDSEKIITQVEEGEKYHIGVGSGVEVFEGTIEECKEQFPNLIINQEQV